MLSARISDYCAGTGLHPDTAGKHLSGLPFTGTRARRYALPFALSRLGAKYRFAAATLIERAEDDGNQFIATLPEMPLIEETVAWLERDPAMKNRLSAARRCFFSSLSRSSRGVVNYYSDVPRLWNLIPVASSVLPYVLTGQQNTLPDDWDDFSRCLALLHSTSPRPEDVDLVA
ncbi:hypothetical protein B6V74_12905 [Thioclava sp. F42-5]|nr:hypothetical protein B6V74_12905 [Thioclava sp. F42-5]